jgi:soluble lytic murein transglycosylase
MALQKMAWQKISAAILVSLTASCLSAAEPDPAELGRGINAYAAHEYSLAIQHLRGANVPKLADYAVYYLAAAEQLTGDFDGALKDLSRPELKNLPAASPLAGKISLLHARLLLDKRNPDDAAKALEILHADYKLLPEPDGDFALGLAYEALDEKPQASLAYEKVYYGSPNTDLAAQSWTAMERLRAALGKDFPTPSARQRLDRCARWLDAKQYTKAREEYADLAEILTGPEKEEAKVGVGVADYLKGDGRAAFRHLKSLEIADHEVNAERLYYLIETARLTDDEDEITRAVADLNEHHAQSPWRMKGLIAAGNHFFSSNERDKYAPLYQAAIDAFPNDSSLAVPHWRVAWDAYLGDKPERVSLLRDQIELYTGESHASTALYFLGRIAEGEGKLGEAHAWYDRARAQFPHYYYGILARERLKEEPKVAAAAPDDGVKRWLAEIDWPAHRDLSDTTPNSATRQTLDRIRLLIAAGLPDIAEAEGRFSAKLDGEQPHLVALELARSAATPFRALRIMKNLAGDYLSVPIEGAGAKVWQTLFPLPYKDDVFRNARARGLDPYYVAALIRQESEFNPGAKSGAGAYGLMQLIPSTGRLMARRQGIPAVRTSSLFNPGINIRLGTEYLRAQLDNWGGNWLQTLAAYNAGPTHVREWAGWRNYREPAEFVESIPFAETREYVQAVLRNADLYREIYSGKLAAELQAPAPAPAPRATPVSTASPKSARSKAGAKHQPA